MSNLPFFIAILAIPILALLAEGTSQEFASAKSSMSIEDSMKKVEENVHNSNGDYQILVSRDLQDTFVFNFNLINSVSKNDMLSCQWNFGDGDTGTIPEILHRYTTAGVYDVDLFVLERDGTEHSFTTKIHVPMEMSQANTASLHLQ